MTQTKRIRPGIIGYRDSLDGDDWEGESKPVTGDYKGRLSCPSEEHRVYNTHRSAWEYHNKLKHRKKVNA